MRDLLHFIGLVAVCLAVSLMITPKGWASDFVIYNTTQIEKDGHSFQIEGIKPSHKTEGMAWLADTASIKASTRPNGQAFVLVGCKEVLLNRHLCKDIKFADGSSVKTAVLERGYGVKK